MTTTFIYLISSNVQFVSIKFLVHGPDKMRQQEGMLENHSADDVILMLFNLTHLCTPQMSSIIALWSFLLFLHNCRERVVRIKMTHQ